MSHRTRRILAYALVVVTAVLAGKLSADHAVSKSRAELEAVAVASAESNRESGLAGCQRGIASYADNARGWREAKRRNLATSHDPNLPVSARIEGRASASVYGTVIEDLTSLMVKCDQAWPPVNTAAVRQAVRQAAEASHP